MIKVERIYLLLILILTMSITSNSFAIEKGERITDREIIEPLIEIKAGQKMLQKQIDDMKTFMLWGFGILFGGMGLLISFILWDRRSALAPAIKKNEELEERERLIEKALKEYAKDEPRLATILRSLNL